MAIPKTPALTTDCVIFDIEGRVLVVRRKNEPFKGSYALPGGFVDIGETVEAACRREVHEEVGIEVGDLTLVGIYSDPKRDPRGHTVSVAYLALLPRAVPPRAGSDAEGAEWMKDWRKLSLAFDHAKIVGDAERTARRRAAASKSKPEESARSSAEAGKIGVLLINLGTPDDTSYWPMRRYLKEFLSDRRVIETNRALWWFILNGIILVKRPRASGAKYRSIWNEERNESPLRTITRSQAEKIGNALTTRSKVVVDWAMRYGSPSIASRADTLVAQGCDRLLAFPLYPQYAAATTATANDKVFEALEKLRAQPALRTVPPYPTDPVYIDALAHSIRAHVASVEAEPEVILASFHGLPRACVDEGDPYQEQCKATVEALRKALGPLGPKLRLTFQSRFGRAEWIKPYTDKTVEALAREGVKRLAVITPGFAADCVETLEEIARENKDIFLEHGGESFSYIPCLNDSDEGIGVLVHMIERELQGWV